MLTSTDEAKPQSLDQMPSLQQSSEGVEAHQASGMGLKNPLILGTHDKEEKSVLGVDAAKLGKSETLPTSTHESDLDKPTMETQIEGVSSHF